MKRRSFFKKLLGATILTPLMSRVLAKKEELTDWPPELIAMTFSGNELTLTLSKDL